ncbi:hypothetical protein [Acholeplasma hippikon]|nr:hypothetical protein [Acholeplasma hippikon]
MKKTIAIFIITLILCMASLGVAYAVFEPKSKESINHNFTTKAGFQLFDYGQFTIQSVTYTNNENILISSNPSISYATIVFEYKQALVSVGILDTIQLTTVFENAYFSNELLNEYFNINLVLVNWSNPTEIDHKYHLFTGTYQVKITTKPILDELDEETYEEIQSLINEVEEITINIKPNLLGVIE